MLYVGTGGDRDVVTTNGNTKIALVENSAVKAAVKIAGEYPIDVTSDSNKNITIDYTAPRIFMYVVSSSSASGYANNAILTNNTTGSKTLGTSPSYLYLRNSSDASFSKALSEFRINDILIPYYSSANTI